MKHVLVVALVTVSAGVAASQMSTPNPTDWIDRDTGHRIVRLSDDAGGSTLYFHDNAFSPEGDKMIFNTPRGIAMIEVAKIGTSALRTELVASPGRGGYFARRTRDIYFSAAGEGTANGRGNSSGAVTAVNVDTRKTRGSAMRQG
jgi:oligogalacturonide lyase